MQSATSSFGRSLSIQARVVWALLMREIITRFGRANLGVLWLFGEPMLFTLGVSVLWTMGGLHRAGGLPVAAFAITGYSSVLMWRNTVSHSRGAIQGNINLLYHRNVLLIDVLLARILLEFGGATASFILLSAIFIAGDWIAPPVDLLRVVVGWVMLAWFGGSLALLIGAATAFSPLVERLWMPTAYLLFPLSGAAFMVDWLPPAAQSVVLLLPMVHGVEVLRAGYFGNAVKSHYDLAYMGSINLLLMLAGLILLRLAARKVEAE
jgi:capsular polysaccharide transport system permease protein